MERKIAAFDARRQFGKVLDEVASGRGQYVIERHGRPVAAVVPFTLYDQWRRQREEFFDHMEQAARRSNLSEEEGMALALEAVREVRAAKRAGRQPSDE